MLTSIKAKIAQTKEFVQKNQIATACTATAIVASAASVIVTRKIDIRFSKAFAYDVGRRAGHVETVLLDTLSFIDEKGLNEEFADFSSNQLV